MDVGGKCSARKAAALLVVALLVVAGAVARVAAGLRRHDDEDLRLVDNGYEGLVVVITDHVPQEHCSHVIHGLKSVLRELSGQLWSATEGRASLREVTVGLPRSWRTRTYPCTLLTPLVDASTPIEGHIRVTGSHPVFGVRPWTQQSQGCGRQGDFIQVGGDFLRAVNNISHAHAARLLLTEWAKFRWGLFDERGHTNDPLYPPTFRDPTTYQWAATGCADGLVRGRTCDPSQPGCSFTPEPYTNTHLRTSLLAFPDLPTVRHLCDDQTHNSVAPNKHNALCGGRSAWQIMRQTVDFAGGRNAANRGGRVLEPTVRFVQQRGPRYIFVIESTATMNLQRRWEFLRKAMRRVVVYDIPDGAHVGVVTFNSEAKTVAPLTHIESEDSYMRQRIGSSLPRNTSPVPESQKCILCGLQEVLTMLDTGVKSPDGATVILITTGSGHTPHEVDEMVRLAKQWQLRFDAVLYPLTERRGVSSAVRHGLENLVEVTRGSIFTVMDEGVGNDSKVKMLVALMDALLAVVQKSAPSSSPGAPVLVHSTAYPGGIASMSSGSFALDDSLGPNARFSIYYYDLNHVGNIIELTPPSSQMINSVNVQEEDGDVNMIFINLENAERGLWTYSVENRADSHQGLFVQVTSKSNSSTGLQVRLWTSSGSRPISSSGPAVPVVVYTEVKIGVSPIMDARVVARLQRLGTNATGSTYQPIFLELWDNGIGDPDVTKGDGVYSRYLPYLPGYPGRYLLTVDTDYNSGLAKVAKMVPVRHKKPPSFLSSYYYHQHGHDGWKSDQTCCGSTLSYVHTRRTPPFLRHVTWGVLEVVSPPPYRDNIPPSRILDLRVEVNDTVHEIILRWTSPGDDWDVGRAHHYEAVVAPLWREARAFQGDRLTGLPQPFPAGTLHTTNLYFTRYEELWFVSVRAVDEVGNTGGVGNIAALWVPHPPTTYEITTGTHPALTTSGNYMMPVLGSDRSVGVMDLLEEDVALILGSIGGFLLVASVVVSYCYCHTSRRHGKQQQRRDMEKTESGSGGNVPAKTGSLGVEDMEGSYEPAEGTAKDNVPGTTRDDPPLPHVQPSSATTLLQGHERSVSVHSRAAGDVPITYSVAVAPLDVPFPDVTMTDYQPAAPDGEEEPPVYLPCLPEVSCHFTVPGPDYVSYTSAWDEPLTGHLLSHARTGAPTPASHQPHLPQADRKRRNVTQV